MERGYLLIETDPARPGVVQARTSGEAPAVTPGLRFVARFDDIDAAMMHLHTALRWRLIDVDARLYRAEIADAVAAADAIALDHRRIYLDPALADDPAIAEGIARLQARHRRWDRIFTGIGIAAVLLLIIQALFGG